MEIPAQFCVEINIFQIEGVEQRRLAGFLTSHHRDDFRSIDGTSVNQHRMINSTEFFNKIGRPEPATRETVTVLRSTTGHSNSASLAVT